MINRPTSLNIRNSKRLKVSMGRVATGKLYPIISIMIFYYQETFEHLLCAKGIDKS